MDTLILVSLLLLVSASQAAQHFRYFPQIEGRSDNIQIPSRVKVSICHFHRNELLSIIQAPTGRPNLIHLVDNRGKDALIAFVEKDDRKIRRRKTSVHYKPWERRVLYNNGRTPPSLSSPNRRVLLRNPFNTPKRQIRPRIRMRNDELDSQESPVFAETAIIPTVAFLSRLAETTWQADPFRARRYVEIQDIPRD